MSDDHEFMVAMDVLHKARVPGESDYLLGPAEAATVRDALGAALVAAENRDQWHSAANEAVERAEAAEALVETYRQWVRRR